MALHDLTALEQAAAIRTGELRAVDLVAHYLARIEAQDPALGAFVTVTGDAALAAAEAADAAVRGRPAGSLPPLHGVAIAIKDLVLTAGVRTTFGSAAFADLVPPIDADVVTLLRDAGTISLGKTATSEFGISLHGETALGPPARNPWRPGYTPGGSSAGAAAAVAAGFIPVAHGNDGGGSVRIPAALCGLVGYKPSRGLVSGGPLGFGGFGLPTNGVIARTVADAAAVLDAMAVPLPGEPFPAPPVPDGGFLAGLSRPVASLRVARFTAPMLAEATVEEACVAAVDTAEAALVAAGHEVREVPELLGVELADRFDTLWAALTVQAPVQDSRVHLLQPLTVWIRERGARLSVPQLFADLSAIQGEVRAALRRLAGFDLLLCPTTAGAHAPIGYFADADPAEDFDRQKRFSPFCAAYNATGQPAVSLPVGRTADGLPVGAMLAAAVGADALLLRVAAQVERLSSWHDRHPEPWYETYER